MLRKNPLLNNQNKEESLAGIVAGGLIGFALGGPAGAHLGAIVGGGIIEAKKDEDRFRRTIL